MQPTFHRRRLGAFALAAVAACALAACGGGSDYTAAPAAPETISAVLTGDQEAPTAVDSAAFGTATFQLDRSTGTLSGTVAVDGVVPTVAHIHLGEAGVAGSIVLPLTIGANQSVSLPATLLTAAQVASLDAGELYVNVHSSTHTSGGIRGQIGRQVFTSLLDGAQETVPVSSAASGTSHLVLNATSLALSGEVEVEGINHTQTAIVLSRKIDRRSTVSSGE